MLFFRIILSTFSRSYCPASFYHSRARPVFSIYSASLSATSPHTICSFPSAASRVSPYRPSFVRALPSLRGLHNNFAFYKRFNLKPPSFRLTNLMAPPFWQLPNIPIWQTPCSFLRFNWHLVLSSVSSLLCRWCFIVLTVFALRVAFPCDSLRHPHDVRRLTAASLCQRWSRVCHIPFRCSKLSCPLTYFCFRFLELLHKRKFAIISRHILHCSRDLRSDTAALCTLEIL